MCAWCGGGGSDVRLLLIFVTMPCNNAVHPRLVSTLLTLCLCLPVSVVTQPLLATWRECTRLTRLLALWTLRGMLARALLVRQHKRNLCFVCCCGARRSYGHSMMNATPRLSAVHTAGTGLGIYEVDASSNIKVAVSTSDGAARCGVVRG